MRRRTQKAALARVWLLTGLQAPEADLLSAGQLLFWPERLFDRDRQFVVLRALPVGI